MTTVTVVQVETNRGYHIKDEMVKSYDRGETRFETREGKVVVPSYISGGLHGFCATFKEKN